MPENLKEQKTNLVDVSEHEMVSVNKTLDTDGSVNTSETVNTGVLENQSMLEQLVDTSLLQKELEGTSHVAGESGDVIQATSVSDIVKVSQMSESGHVLTRPESIMLQNFPNMLFGVSLIFCLLCLFLCFLDMGYADNSYI